MGEAAGTAGVIGGDVARAAQQIAVGHQALQPDRPARRQRLGADAHLGAEAVAETIGEAGGAVQVHTGAVDAAQEQLGRGGVGGADGVGVTRTVTSDMGKGLLHALHHLHRQDQIRILSAPVVVAGRCRHAEGLGGAITAQLDAGGRKGRQSGRQESGRCGAVHQQGLDRVAGGRVLGLAVERHPQGLGHIHLLVDVEVTDAIGVAENGDAGVVLDEAHQGVGTARNDQIHQPVEPEQRQALLAAGEQLQRLGGHGTGRQTPLQGGENRGTAAAGLAAALENGAVAGADRQRRDLHHRIGPRLEDHTHHPERHAQAFEHQPLIKLAVQLAHAKGIRQRRHLAHPLDRRGQLGRIQLQTRHQGRRQAFGGRGRQVGGVGGDDRLGIGLEGRGHRQ